MKLPKTYFENLSATRYREYLKLLPGIHKEHVQLITMLIFTFTALSFFGVFAINPTLSTIITLKKQLADSEAVHQQLKTKINNLSLLQQQYTQLNADLPVIFDAIPQDPAAALLSGQIQALTKETNLTVQTFTVSEVQLTDVKSTPTGSSFIFTLEAKGTYDNMLAFISSLTDMSRIVTVESVAMTRDKKDQELMLIVRGRQYFKP